MNNEQGYYRFEDRKYKNFNDELYNIGLTEHDAWFKRIIYLQEINYVVDYKPIYYKDNSSLVFKKIINKKNSLYKIKD